MVFQIGCYHLSHNLKFPDPIKRSIQPRGCLKEPRSMVRGHALFPFLHTYTNIFPTVPTVFIRDLLAHASSRCCFTNLLYTTVLSGLSHFYLYMGLSENRVYSQWNSHLIGIMISKTGGLVGLGVHNIFRHTHIGFQPSGWWFFSDFAGPSTVSSTLGQGHSIPSPAPDAVSTATATALRITRHGGTEGSG